MAGLGTGLVAGSLRPEPTAVGLAIFVGLFKPDEELAGVGLAIPELEVDGL